MTVEQMIFVLSSSYSYQNLYFYANLIFKNRFGSWNSRGSHIRFLLFSKNILQPAPAYQKGELLILLLD